MQVIYPSDFFWNWKVGEPWAGLRRLGGAGACCSMCCKSAAKVEHLKRPSSSICLIHSVLPARNAICQPQRHRVSPSARYLKTRPRSRAIFPACNIWLCFRCRSLSPWSFSKKTPIEIPPLREADNLPKTSTSIGPLLRGLLLCPVSLHLFHTRWLVGLPGGKCLISQSGKVPHCEFTAILCGMVPYCVKK